MRWSHIFIGAVPRLHRPASRGGSTSGAWPAPTACTCLPGLEHPAGLVVNLHGAGAIGAGWEWETNYDAVADAHGFIVVYPDGIDFSWADGRGASVPDRQGIDDVGFITGLVAKLVSDFGIDPGHVYATGMSAGAFMVNRLACERADVFAAIAPVAGNPGREHRGAHRRGRWRCLDDARHRRSGRAFQRRPHGRSGRPQRHHLRSRMAARWRQAGGAVEFSQIDGGGHIWPGDAVRGVGAVLRQPIRGSWLTIAGEGGNNRWLRQVGVERTWLKRIKVPPDLMGGDVDEGYGKVADAFRRRNLEQWSRSRSRCRGLPRWPQGRRPVGRLPQRVHSSAVGARHHRQRVLDDERRCLACRSGRRFAWADRLRRQSGRLLAGVRAGRQGRGHRAAAARHTRPDLPRSSRR